MEPPPPAAEPAQHHHLYQDTPDPTAAAAPPAADERPEKRQRLDDEQQQQQQQTPGDADVDGPPPPGPPPAAQLTQVLARIQKHLGTATKFAKASQLLRQVLDAVDRAHRDDLFAAVTAAFLHPQHAVDPLLRKEYMRLTKALQLRADVFSKRQQAQLEVYVTWGLLQNELFTDDSFALNKVVGRIKGAIAALPDGDEEQAAAWFDLFPQQAAELGLTKPAAAAVKASAKQPPAAAAAAAAEEEEEADPFGLDAFLAQADAEAGGPGPPAAAAAAGDASTPADQPQAQPDADDAAPAAAAAAATEPPQQPPPVWDAVSCLVMRKQALLDCLETAKTHQHKLAWARTSVELMIEEAAKPAAQGGHAGKFVAGQQAQLAALMAFVNAERTARRSGVNRRPGGKGTGEYQTSFERARAEWGSASWVSARGKVGNQGDGSNAAWLG